MPIFAANIFKLIMKKLLLTITAALAFTAASAQIATNKGKLFSKPVKGDWSAEIKFNPSFLGDAQDVFTLNDSNADFFYGDVKMGIKIRKFTADNKAFRITAGVSTFSEQGDGYKQTLSFYSLTAGIEKHFKGSERLSTYWGYQGRLGFTDFFNNGGATTVFAAGADILAGVEYYFMPQIYLGTEVSYGFTYVEGQSVFDGEMNAFGLNKTINPNFRLGIKF